MSWRNRHKGVYDASKAAEAGFKWSMADQMYLDFYSAMDTASRR